MKIKVNIDCREITCGRCSMKEQHSNFYPENYRCLLFGKWLHKKSGTWQTGLSFFRLKECKDAELHG